MDTKTLIKNLHALFCKENKGDRKYSKVWLSEVETGGLYNTGKYVLNVQAEHEIDNCNDEIRSVISLLNEKAKEELQLIQRVDVHHSGNRYYCQSGDLLIFEQEDACS